MDALWREFLRVVGERLPNLAGGLAVLVLGWCAALIISALLRGLFRRTGWDVTLTRWIAGKEAAAQVQPGKWIATGVYYFLMLLVLVAFFEAVGLAIVTGPLNQILIQVSDYAPRIVSAVLLLLLALILARLVKAVISRVLSIANVDDRLGESTGLKRAEKLPVSDTVATAAYWLVFLLFLPAVLQALALEGLLEPVQGMVSKILGFLPNLVASALILLLGLFIARIVQRIVANVLAAAGVDRLSQRTGLTEVLGKQTLSEVIGLVVYVLIVIPVAIAALDALQIASISAPASQILAKVFGAIPAVFTAALVLVIAYLVGRFVAGLATSLLGGIGFNTLFERLGLAKPGSRTQRTPSEVVGYLVTVAVVLFAVIEAARLVGFTALAELLVQFMTFAAQVLLGLVIFGIGLYLANLAAGVIRERNATQGGTLALAARVSIITLATAMALGQMGVAKDIITMAFTLLLGSLAVAVALAFGLGSRDLAAREVERWLKRLKGT